MFLKCIRLQKSIMIHFTLLIVFYLGRFTKRFVINTFERVYLFFKFLALINTNFYAIFSFSDKNTTSSKNLYHYLMQWILYFSKVVHRRSLQNKLCVH